MVALKTNHMPTIFPGVQPLYTPSHVPSHMPIHTLVRDLPVTSLLWLSTTWRQYSQRMPRAWRPCPCIIGHCKRDVQSGEGPAGYAVVPPGPSGVPDVTFRNPPADTILTGCDDYNTLSPEWVRCRGARALRGSRCIVQKPNRGHHPYGVKSSLG